jgi:signal transduction histidine kinase
MMQKAAKISTEFNSPDSDVTFNNEKSVIVFRMIQEVLHNILKHAKAKNVTVTLADMPGKIMIEIKDDGKGFDISNLKSTETGIGLKSIQQRCELINGNCKIDSKSGFGTSVKLILLNS